MELRPVCGEGGSIATVERRDVIRSDGLKGRVGPICQEGELRAQAGGYERERMILLEIGPEAVLPFGFGKRQERVLLIPT